MCKTVFTIAFMLCALFRVQAQSSATTYDKALADSLGADDYGMKMYTLVLLRTGPTQLQDKTQRDSLFRGHLQNIGRLAREGRLIVAGPLQKNDNHYEGIFIFNVKTKQEARSLLASDPAIAAGLLAVDIYGWYGSAALPLYLPYHDKVQKKKF